MKARDDDEEPTEGRGRSRRKRAAEALKDLGDALVALPPAECDALGLPEKLNDAIALARRITAHGAAARQRQLIGKILRQVDVSEIEAALEARALAKRLAAREFHRIETWRDRLLNEGETALEALGAASPGLDLAPLRTLVLEAQREAAAGRPPAAARELFRRLRAALAPAAPNA